MVMKAAGVCWLLLLTVCLGVWAEEQTCVASARSCEECVASGPQCAWCTSLSAHRRCHTAAQLLRSGCPRSAIYQPRSSLLIARNEPGSGPEAARALLLQPQEVHVTLRPGGTLNFSVTSTAPTLQPLPQLTVDTSTLPAGVNVTITQGQPAVIEVSAEAGQCGTGGSSSNRTHTGPWTLHVGPQGSHKLKIVVTLECECECSSKREENSPRCSRNGALVCGHCHCNEPYVGQQCNFNVATFFSDMNDDKCRSHPFAPLCSDNGDCVMGSCECKRRENPQEIYHGKFCECTNFNCDRSSNRLCGGHGRCECDRCVCEENWGGTACDCYLDSSACMAANQQICNGRGICECGQCRCQPPYTGPTCEVCPTCPGLCGQNVACVECRVFGRGPKMSRCEEECGSLAVSTVPTKDDLPSFEDGIRFCKMRSPDDAWFYYTLAQTPSGMQATVAKAEEHPSGWGA